MYCKSCGTEIEEEAKFCPNCGSTVHENSILKNKIIQNIKKHKASYSVLILLVTVGCLIFNMFATEKSTYETPIENLVEAIETRDTEKYIEIFPEDFLEYARTNFSNYGMSFEQSIQASFNVASILGNVSNLKVKYTINSAIDCSQSEIADKIESLENETNLTFDISEAKKLDVTVVFRSGDQMDTKNDTMTVIKIEGKWYIDPMMFI